MSSAMERKIVPIRWDIFKRNFSWPQFFFSQITAQRENSFCVNSISDFVFLQKVHIVTAILVEMEESAQILAMVLNVTASRDLPAEFVS